MMILYYNVHAISNYVKNFRESQVLLSDRFSDRLLDNYDYFNLNTHNMVYDRTGILPHFLNITPDLHPMPGNEPGYNKDFFSITEDRAKELLSLGKPINVMWSGGIDSTYILFVLKYFANDPDQIRVYGTYNSIIESGDLFDRRIKTEFKHHIKVTASNEFNCQELDGIYVSGMCGNQLFGPTDNFFANGDTAMFHHTLGTPETIYESYKQHIDPALLEFLQPVIDASPRKIETVADLRWYCIFNLDWYTAQYEHKVGLPEKVAKNIYGFFDSIDFQKWAINTKEPFTKIKGDPNTHRWQMRQVLSELFDEPHYATNKDKKISNFAGVKRNWICLLNNYRNVYLRQVSTKY